MTDNWCPKHLRTIGALVPCGECEEERKGPKRYHYMHDGDGYDARLVSIPSGIKKEDLRGDYVNASDYDALLAAVSALEKEVAGLRADLATEKEQHDGTFNLFFKCATEAGEYRELLEEARDVFESDLMAVGHSPDGEARTHAMLGLRRFIDRINERLDEYEPKPVVAAMRTGEGACSCFQGTGVGPTNSNFAGMSCPVCGGVGKPPTGGA